MNLPERLKSLMFSRGDISQQWLGDAVGMTQSAISKVLRGDQRLYLDQAIAIAKALKVDLNELVGEEAFVSAGNEKDPDISAILRIVETLGVEESLARLTQKPRLTINLVDDPSSSGSSSTK